MLSLSPHTHTHTHTHTHSMHTKPFLLHSVKAWERTFKKKKLENVNEMVMVNKMQKSETN